MTHQKTDIKMDCKVISGYFEKMLIEITGLFQNILECKFHDLMEEIEGKIKEFEIKKETQPDKMRIKDAAEYFGISEAWFRQAVERRTIPHYKLKKMTFVSAREIEAMIEEGRIEAK